MTCFFVDSRWGTDSDYRKHLDPYSYKALHAVLSMLAHYPDGTTIYEYDEDTKRWVYDWCIPCTLQGAHLALYFDSRIDTTFIIEEIKPM